MKSKKKTSDYKCYPAGTWVRVISLNKTGEAFIKEMGFISVFFKGESGCKYFDIADVEFLKKGGSK